MTFAAPFAHYCPLIDNTSTVNAHQPMNNPAHYVDLQVNGYAGVDFNSDQLSAESLHACCAQLGRDGVAGVLATVITDQLPAMAARLARIVAIRDQDPLVREMIWGLHIEGPFLNETPGYVGAHPRTACAPPTATPCSAWWTPPVDSRTS